MSAGEDDSCSATSSTPSSPALHEVGCEKREHYSQVDFQYLGASEVSVQGRSKPDSKVKQIKECKVCGDDTTGTYFGAVVCLPCKTFFIRYGAEGGRRLRCRNKNSCPVTMSTRTRCKYCRLMKCFSVGMARKERPEVIHAAQGQELCSVCADIANGIHFGTYTCEGCKKFFRRGLKEHESYRCSLYGNCVINPRSRNACRYCRYQKCLVVGMTSKVRVGRPRKLHRDSILNAVHERNLQGGFVESTANLASPAERFQDTLQNGHALTANESFQVTDATVLHNILPPSDLMSNQQTDTSDQMLVFQPKMIEITPEDRNPSPNDIDSFYRVRDVATTMPAMAVNLNDSDDRRSVHNTENGSLTGQIQIDGYTYVLSDILQGRFYNTILPYWRNPRIPSGNITLSAEQKALIQKVTSNHQVAINCLQGSPPSADVIFEAQNSVEMTPTVAEYMRHRLVLILTSFIGFIKTQPVFQNIDEIDMSLLLRMNVSTWALVGAATHFFSPLNDSLPRSLVDIQLHPENPHAALNERNLRLAKRLHALNMDDSEAALLSTICVLATDLAKMNNPDAVETTRWMLLETFQAYATLKYGLGNKRLEELFSIVPEMRLAAIWFNDLSYLTWFPSSP